MPVLGQFADTVATVLLAAAGAWLCNQVAADAGTPLWQGRLAREVTRRWNRNTSVACAVVLGGHIVAARLETGILGFGPALRSRAEQVDVTGLQDPVLLAVQALASGLREEVPLLLLPAAVMAAARRPAWQILMVVCASRVIPHAYLGLPCLASAVFAAVGWWMYRATGRIGPVIVGHMLFKLALMGPVGFPVQLLAPVFAVVLLALTPDIAPRWMTKKSPRNCSTEVEKPV